MSDPRENEANDQPGTFEFRGLTLTVPLERDDWTVDFLESLEEGKSVGIVRGAIGPDSWRQVRSMNLKVRELNELADLIAKAMGFGSTGE